MEEILPGSRIFMAVFLTRNVMNTKQRKVIHSRAGRLDRLIKNNRR